MSQLDALLKDIKAAAFDLGIPALAAKSGVSDDSVRRLLKDPPLAIKNLRKLEQAAADLRAEPAPETGNAAP